MLELMQEIAVLVGFAGEGNVQSEVKLQTCHQDVAGERFVEELKSSGSSKKKHKRKRRNHPNKKINLDRWKL